MPQPESYVTPRIKDAVQAPIRHPRPRYLRGVAQNVAGLCGGPHPVPKAVPLSAYMTATVLHTDQ